MAETRRNLVVADHPIPYCPRTWAEGLHASFRRWAVLVLHRRAGKTTCELNHHQHAVLDDDWERGRLAFLLPEASSSHLTQLMQERCYWHVMPSYKQAELVGWGILQRIADPVVGRKFNQQKLRVTYPHGHVIQLLGADDPDSLRGPGLSGVSLDEYSQIPAKAFGEVLSKALADHLGYAIFSGTIQGTDQLYQMYQAVKDDPEWFSLWQDVDESLRTERGATIDALTRAMEDDRKLVRQGIMAQAEFDQEWYLSPEAAIKGAIYAIEMQAARSSGRVTAVPYDPALPVDTDWDLGILDKMAIWFSQSTRGGEVRLIDYYEACDEGLPHYATVLREKGYTYGTHWAPHDIEVRELASGRTRRAAAAALGIKFQIVPRVEVEDGIHAAKLLFPRCWFDQGKTKIGLDCLSHYRKRFNSSLQEFTNTPVHDVWSHGADAFRGLAVRQKPPTEKKPSGMFPWSQPSSEMGWLGA